MYHIQSIGTIEKTEDGTIIRVNKKFQKALKYVEEFSHIHVFLMEEKSKEREIKKEILAVREVNLKMGILISSTKIDLDQEAGLLDIKPYFPSEDSVRKRKDELVHGKYELDFFQGERIAAHSTEDPQISEVAPCGVIRKVNGTCFIQMNSKEMIQRILQEEEDVSGAYLIVFWWFHKFDKEQYRRATECDPPYENAPRSGIFATRSPVRPNPIGMTITRIQSVDKNNKRIYVDEMESFDQTPCIGIAWYDWKEHCVQNPKVPSWLAHWPKCIDEKESVCKDGELVMENSDLYQMIKNLGVSKTEAGKEEKERNERSGRRITFHEDHIRRPEEIMVYGAREHNLKGIDVRIPYSKITAVVGVSGSGKSSLVNHTIYAECRRRMEYLSHSNTMFQRPDADEIVGCIPAVVIGQDSIRGNSFSTVGTYTGTYDYLRNLFASIAIRHCPNCGHEVIPLSRESILSLLRETERNKIFSIAGELISETSLEDRVDKALKEGEGAFYTEIDHKKILLQTKQKCYHCDTLLFEMTPAMFSYMDGDYRCPVCYGTGKRVQVDEEKVIEHPELSLLDGASSFYGKLRTFRENSNANWMKGQVFGLADAMKVDLELSWKELPDEFRTCLLYGSKQEVTFSYKNKKNGRNGEITRQVEGMIPIIARIHEENSTHGSIEKYMKMKVCDACQGERLGLEGRMATICGSRYPEATKMTFYELEQFCDRMCVELGEDEYKKVESAIHSVLEITSTAIKLGIGYLPLNRETGTLSGGEGQRIKLLTAFRNHITGILYIFDEPSKGLHPRDYNHIIGLIKELREEGNTILLVEHNEDMIQIADHIIEIGPGAGDKGGMLVGEGTLEAMIGHSGTQISRYWNHGGKQGQLFKKSGFQESDWVHMKELSQNNLQNIDIAFPKEALTCICGISGSGKSTLMKGEIYGRAQADKNFSGVVLVDQLPIGKTSKSIIATYIGVMDVIRSEFANVPEAIQNEWDEKFFSFNNSLGQCDTCAGEGQIKVKYTEGIQVTCPDCQGKRYQKRILGIRNRGKNIHEILELSVEEAILFWEKKKEVVEELKFLKKVGLGYLKLGQGTATLSGGEAARLKLAKELMTKKRGNILYLMDEPTTGLHFSDIENLLQLIGELIHNGNTVISIEHNRQFVEYCNWMIELGPGAGQDGGTVIFQGQK